VDVEVSLTGAGNDRLVDGIVLSRLARFHPPSIPRQLGSGSFRISLHAEVR
jgi:hypothetical protein